MSEAVHKTDSQEIVWRDERIWIAAVAALPLILFFPYYFRSMAIGDNAIGLVPHYRWFASMIKSFQDPLWNNLLCGGFPMSGYPNENIYNPLTWIHIFLPATPATNLQIILTHSIAGIGFYYWGRSMNLGKRGAFAAGAIYSTSGFMLSSFQFILAHVSLAWIGFMLAALEKMRVAEEPRDRVRRALIFGLISGLVFISGHPMIFLHAGLFAGLYTLIVGIGIERGKRRWSWFLCSLAGISMTPFLGAAVFLPARELLQFSWRHSLSMDNFIGTKISPIQLFVSTISPNMGDVAAQASPLAVIPFMFVCYGAARGYKDVRIIALIIIAVFSAILMLGDVTPIPKLLYYVPLFNLISSSTRFGIEFTMACVILAGYGIEQFLKLEKYKLIYVIISFTALESIIFLYAIINDKSQLIFILIGLIASIVCIYSIYRFKVTKKEVWFCAAFIALLIEPKIFIRSYLKDNANIIDFSRPVSITRHFDSRTGNAPPPLRVLPVIDLRKHSMNYFYDFGAQNLSMLHGIQNATGYQSLFLERYAKLLDADFNGFPNYFKKLIEPPNATLDLLNIGHIEIPKNYIAGDLTYRLSTFPDPITVDGIKFRNEMYLELGPKQRVSFNTPLYNIDGIAAATSLADSFDVEQGAPAIKISLMENEATNREVILKAGEDTADMAWEMLTTYSKPSFNYKNIPFYDQMDILLYPKDNRIIPLPDYNTQSIGLISYLFRSRNIAQGTEVARIVIASKDGAKSEIPIRAGIESADFSINYGAEEVKHKKADAAATFNFENNMVGNLFFTKINLQAPVEINQMEIRVSDRTEGAIYIRQITLIGPDGKSIPALPRKKPRHKMAKIYPMKTDKTENGASHHLYYTIKHFDKSLIMNSMTIENLCDRAKVNIRAVTLLRKDKKQTPDSQPLSYVDYNLGNPNKYSFEELPEILLWHAKGEKPRAWLAGSAEYLDPAEILSAIKTGKLPDGRTFDYWNVALADNGQPFVSLPGGETDGQIEFIKYAANEIIMKVYCDRKSMLVLSEMFYPGWTAEVDGKPERVYQVDYVLRGTIVNAGRHEVTFRFRPKPVRTGRIISGAAMALSVFALILLRRHRKQNG